MKRILLATMASGLALAAAAAPVGAAIIIGIGFNGGAITQVATDGTSGSASYVATANGYFSNAGAVGFPLLAQPTLLTQSVNIQPAGTPGTLNLYITQTDLNAFGGSLVSSFTSNTVTNATALLRTYYSNSNALFGGTLLASSTFAGTGVQSFTNAITAPGTFSTTVRYDITFGPGTGNFNGTANLAAVAVPEPATWAMMLFGFGGFGYAMRRRRTIGARIRFV